MELEKGVNLYYYNRLWSGVRWLVLCFTMLYAFFPHDGFSPSTTQIYILLGLGVAFNVAVPLLPKRYMSNRMILIQSLSDIFAITFLTWFTGTHESYFVYIYFLILFGTCYVLDTKTMYMEAALITLLFSSSFLYEHFMEYANASIFNHLTNLLLVLTSLWLMAYFSGYLTTISKNLLRRHKELSKKNEELYIKESVARNRLDARYQISQALNSTMEVFSALPTIYKELSKTVNFDYMSLGIFEKDKKEKASCYIFNNNGLLSMEEGVSQDKVYNSSVFKDKKPVIRSSENNPNVCNYKLDQTVRSSLNIPLIFRGRVLGSFCLFSSKDNAFGKTDLELIEPVIEELSISMENTNLYRELNRQAAEDALTKVYNRRYFQQFLKKELAQAKRYKKNLSLIMLDVDYFKTFNDTYGHPRGDLVLKEVAKVLKSNVREGDVVARYGGDEFIILLTGANRWIASSVTKRLKKKIEEQQFKTGIKDFTYFGVSMGVASYPFNATDQDELIKKADEFLYGEKRHKKNSEKKQPKIS